MWDKNGLSLFTALVKLYIQMLSRDTKQSLPWAVPLVLDREELDLTCANSLGKTLLYHVAQDAPDGPTTLLDLSDWILSCGAESLFKCKDDQIAVAVALEYRILELALKLL